MQKATWCPPSCCCYTDALPLQPRLPRHRHRHLVEVDSWLPTPRLELSRTHASRREALKPRSGAMDHIHRIPIPNPPLPVPSGIERSMHTIWPVLAPAAPAAARTTCMRRSPFSQKKNIPRVDTSTSTKCIYNKNKYRTSSESPRRRLTPKKLESRRVYSVRIRYRCSDDPSASTALRHPYICRCVERSWANEAQRI